MQRYPLPAALNLLTLISLMMMSHIAFTGGRVALSLGSLQLGGSTFMVGVLMSLLTVVPMFMSVLAGRWTDRVGTWKPIFIALALVSSGTILPGLRPQLSSLYLASVLIGSGFMLAHIAVNNGVGNASTPETRTRAFTMLALGFSTTTILGPVIAGFSIDLIGHMPTFLLLAAFPGAALAVMPFLRPKIEAAPAPHVAAAPPVDARVMDLLGNLPLRAVFVVSGLLSMAWDMFTFMVPVQGARIGLSASTIGIIMGTFGVATFVVRLALPWIARTLSEWQTLTAALAVTAFVYFMFPLFTAVPVLMALAFLLGLGLGSTQPMIMSLLHMTSPVGRTGEAVGVRTTLMNASHSILPLAFGALGTAMGMIPAFWTLALFMSGGAMFAGKRKPE